MSISDHRNFTKLAESKQGHCDHYTRGGRADSEVAHKVTLSLHKVIDSISIIATLFSDCEILVLRQKRRSGWGSEEEGDGR